MAFKRYKTIFTSPEAKYYEKVEYSYEKFAQMILTRINQNRDCTILVTGVTGGGKSTMVGKLCFQQFSKILNPVTEEGMMYDDDNFIIDPEEFAAKMIQKKGSVLWWDEAVDGVSKRNWHSKINNLIIQRKNKNRKLRNCYFIIIPYEKEVDKSLANHINVWMHLSKRGVAEIYIANNNRKGGQALDINSIIEREEKWRKENPGKIKPKPTVHPEYIGRLFSGAFSIAEQKRYDELVELNSATGKLTEEEQEKYGEQELNITPEKHMEVLIQDMMEEKLKSKKELWDVAKMKTGLDGRKLETMLNFYLNMNGFGTFKKLSTNFK